MNRRSPSGPRISWQDPVAAFADLPLDGNQDGDARITTTTDEIWIWNGVAWVPPSGLATDEKVKVTAADTTPGYLADKIPTTGDVQAAVGAPGADEDLLLSVVGITESSGPTSLPISAIPDPSVLVRMGAAIVGVPAVPPTAHAPTHRPATGTDPLATAAAVGVGGGNALGAADSFSRSDHGHAITETSGPTDLTVGSIPAGSFLARIAGSIVGVPVPPDTTQLIPQPVCPATAQSTRALPAASLFEGACYFAARRTSFTSIIGRLTAGAVGGIVRVAIYQVAGGLPDGTAALLAAGAFTIAVGGAQNFSIPVAATVLEEGYFYILQGRATPAIAMTSRVYTFPTIELLNSTGVAGEFPIVFTTAISAVGAPPAIFDPVVSGTLTTLNVAPVMRLS